MSESKHTPGASCSATLDACPKCGLGKINRSDPTIGRAHFLCEAACLTCEEWWVEGVLFATAFAAPELLEALEAASALMDAMDITEGTEPHGEHPIRIQARAAIAKAKGES
ncbi:MAG: hypothetical protein V3V24_09885 [Nitrospinaceae bacterium]